jgi:nucleoid DNA-binding protein
MANKKDLIKFVSHFSLMSEYKTEQIIDNMCEYITQQLEQGNSVNITGFGTFSVKQGKPKIKMEDDEIIPIKGDPKVDFRTGDTLAKRLKENLSNMTDS